MAALTPQATVGLQSSYNLVSIIPFYDTIIDNDVLMIIGNFGEKIGKKIYTCSYSAIIYRSSMLSSWDQFAQELHITTEGWCTGISSHLPG